MTPTWYDLLGLDSDASEEEIRAAWKSGISELDPGDRRFRTLNEAAEVLLDPERRGIYDRTVAAEMNPPTRVEAFPGAESKAVDSDDRSSTEVVDAATHHSVESEEVAAPQVGAGLTTEVKERKLGHFGERALAFTIDWLVTLPGTMFLVAAGPALFASVTIGILFLIIGLCFSIAVPIYNRIIRHGRTGQSWGKSVTGLSLVDERTGTPPGMRRAFVREISHVIDALPLYIGYLRPIWDDKRQTFADSFNDTVVVESEQPRSVPTALLGGLAAVTGIVAVCAAVLTLNVAPDAEVAADTSQAQGSAERAVVTILAYDYRTLDEDQKAAGALMTSDYKKKYDQLFEVIKENSEAVKPVVTVDVVASGVVRSGEDRVQVLVFVNRPTTNAKSQEPTVFRDQVRVTMVKSGDDWLVDDMQTSPTTG